MQSVNGYTQMSEVVRFFTLAAAVVPSPFTFLPLAPPPNLLILFFLFSSSKHLPISDLGGLVDAILKEAINMNLDILGSAFVPVAVMNENVFDGGVVG